MAYVYHAGTGTYQPVTNLGWLRRHADEVTEIRTYRSEHGTVVHAELTGNRLFITEWTSYSVCRQWLSRPSFASVPVTVNERQPVAP